MPKKRARNQNPEPFLPEDDGNATAVSSRSRSRASKRHRKGEKLISSGMTSRILKEALLQQKEIREEADEEQSPNNPLRSVKEPPRFEEGVDDFVGFSETQSRFVNYDEEVNEEDERLLEAFLSKDAGPQRALADLIVAKIKEADADVDSEVRPKPKLEESLIDCYKGIGVFLSKYTVGKLPKPFKFIPSMPMWEEVLHLTEPARWSPHAMYQATRLLSSNLSSIQAKRFYELVLLPRVREDIRKDKKLHPALYQSLEKSLYKPGAFYKGILLPLCESGTCSLTEAAIVGSVLGKVSVPMQYSGATLMTLAEMEFCGTTSYFIKLLIDKKYSLSYRVLDTLVAHFMRFEDDSRTMPVIWHQSLLAFVQRYKNALRKEDKDSLRTLLEKQRHYKVTPEIIQELNNSLNRGEEKDDLMLMSTPVSIINKAIVEDRFDIPEVPMEED